MRILVIGGTGFIGTPLVRHLLAADHEVAVFSRGEKSIPGGVQAINGTRALFDQSMAEVDQFDPEVVVDIFAMTDAETRPVFTALAPRDCRYVMISSCDVYRVFGFLLGIEDGAEIDGLQDEEAPLRSGRYPYAHIPNSRAPDYDKIPLEELLFDLFSDRATVMRLPMIVGSGDPQHRFRDPVLHMARGRPAILLPDAYAHWTSTYGHIANVVAAIACAATHDAAGGVIFNVGELPLLTQYDWYSAIAKKMGWKGQLVVAPAGQLPEKRGEMAAGVNFRQDLKISAAKLRTDLDFEPSVDFDSALEDVIDWERRHLDGLEEHYDFEADDAWIAEM